jgi:GDP-L-fucose synthase
MLRDKRIIVTGGAGFLGSHLVRLLHEEEKVPKRNVFVPRSKDYDLRSPESVSMLFHDFSAEMVFHLATTSAGMGYNKKHVGSLCYDNLMMGSHLLEQARRSGVEKFVTIGSALSYPENAPIPLIEESFWDGLPEKTLAAFAIAMRTLLVQGQAYRQEHGFNSIYLIPANLYGPGDTLDPERAHVIPSVIMKIEDAIRTRATHINAWGSGRASREFLYAEDAARGILMAAKHYDKPEPINLGSGMEITMQRLYDQIASLRRYKGRINFDETKLGGQLRRCVDSSKARREFGFVATTGFDEGLKITVSWYKKQISKQRTGA